MGSQTVLVDEFRLIPNPAHCEILINDVPLLELIAERERQLHLDPPSRHLLLPAALALLPSRHLFGEHQYEESGWCADWSSWGLGEDKTAIASCICGDVGCGPLLVTIELHRGVVTWHGFVSRSRSDYHLGFTFARKRYEHQLQQGSREL